MKKLSLLTILTLSIIGMAEITQAPDPCTYTKPSVCNRHSCHWSNKKCRKGKKLKKVKAIPAQAQPIAVQGPTAPVTTISGSSLQNMLSDMSVTFLDAQGNAITTSVLPNNATIQIPANAINLQVGPDADDFDAPQSTSINGLQSNIAYVIGVDDNNNLAVGTANNSAGNTNSSSDSSNNSNTSGDSNFNFDGNSDGSGF